MDILVRRHVYDTKVFHCPGLACAVAGEPLLNGVNPVPDSYFTATTEVSVDYAAHSARLDGDGFSWIPLAEERTAVPPTFYLQVSQV